MPATHPLLVSALLAAGALALRLAAAWSGPDLWIDEANGVLIAGRPVSEILASLRADSSPPLSYLLLHAWMGLFGDSPFAVRSLSAVWGALAAGVTCMAGWRLLSPAAGVLGGLYVAVCPVAIFHGSQARMYALLPLLAVGALYSFARFLQHGGAGRLAAGSALTALALWTHNMAVFLLPAQGLLWLVAPRGAGLAARARGVDASGAAHRGTGVLAGPGWQAMVLHFLLITAAYAPWLPALRHQARGVDHYAWFDGFWAAWGVTGVSWRSLQSLAPGGEFVFYAPFGVDLWRGATAVAAAGLAALGGAVLARRRRELGAVAALWAPAGLLVPAAGALLLSAIWRPVLVPGRVDQMVLPFFALLVGAGLAGVQPLRARQGIVVLLVGVALVSHVRWQQRIAPGGPRGAQAADAAAPARAGEGRLAADLLAAAGSGDLALFTSLSRAPVEYALRRRGGALALLSFPRGTAAHLGNQNDAALLSDPEALRAEARAVVADLAAHCPAGCRAFVVHVPAPVNVPLLQELRGREGVVAQGSLGRYRQTGTGLPLDVLTFQVRPGTAAPAAESTGG